jgi:hypothetical protein
MIGFGRLKLRGGIALVGALLCLAALAAAPAGARLLEVPKFVAPGLNPDLSPSTAPGGRPYEFVNNFALNQTPTLEGVTGTPANVRDLRFELPPGLVANAATYPRCTAEAFSAATCATVAQAGVAELGLSGGGGELTVPVFNMAPPPGMPAQFAFRTPHAAVHIDFALRAGSDYGVTATVNGLSEAAGVLTSAVRIWGVPGDPGHDAMRFTGSGASAAGPYPDDPPFKPLLSNPTSCNGPLITTMEAVTWQPGAPIFAAPFEAPGTAACNQLEFSPTIEAKPTTNLADSPSGLNLHLHLPQIQDPEGSASAQLRSVRINLPAGFDVNPAVANGLGTCSEQQIGLVDSANERQLLRYDLPPINFSGSFTVSRGGASTASISAAATSAQVAAAIETLPGLAGNIRVGGARGGWVVTFVGALAGQDVPLLTGNVSDVPSQTLAVTGEGGTYELESEGVSTGPLPYNATPAEIQAALRTIPSLNLGNIFPGNVFVNSAGEEESTRSFQILYVGDLIGKQPPLSANASLEGPGSGVLITPTEPPAPRNLSVASFGGNSPGTLQFTPAPAGCPDASKIGSVRVDSPSLVDHPLIGNVYLADPDHNPFGSLLAVYLTVEDPASGTIVKLPGRVEADPATGRLTATVTEAPQLPFEDLQIELFKGTAAPLRTPIACRLYTVESLLTPWSSPEGAPRRPKDAFEIEKGAGGGACAGDPANAPDTPRFVAGTLDPSAGIYTAFSMKLARPDGSKPLTGIDTTLPVGLLAQIAGRSLCSDGAIAAAAAHSAAGAGPEPYNLSGSAYLAGPYHGAPFSLALVTPALAGPFDLGTVVVRVALGFDPKSTRVRVTSDPFPLALKGLPVDLRSVALNLDSGFIKNPTSCNPLEITGASPTQTARFQVGDCKKLAFSPKLSLSLKGGTKAGSHPALTTTVTYPSKTLSANLAAAQVTLPKSLKFDRSHAGASCSASQLASSTCPPASVYGQATAETPLLPNPLRGPIYLRGGTGSAPPQLIVALDGPVDVNLEGALATTKAGALRASFEGLPDAPITKLTLAMSGAKKGLFKAAGNLCRGTNKASVQLDGQNGSTSDHGVALGTSCKKAAKHKRGKRAGR